MSVKTLKKVDSNDWGQPVINVATTANTAYDQNISVASISGRTFNEIMLTLQRVSNGRTFATTVCPFGQFLNAAIYAGGNFTLLADAAYINVVCIYGASSYEIAAPAISESIRIRVFVR